jgi:serine/threonine-protein kinase
MKLATLDGFLLSQREVTNAEYAFYLRATGGGAPPDWKDGKPPGRRSEDPVAQVTWEEADAYAKWLGMRLPTDLEWERAVRGTVGNLYPWGNEFDPARANLARATRPAPAPRLLPATRHVSRRDDSPLYHLVGNVREWTSTAATARSGKVTHYFIVGGSAADRPRDAAATARARLKPDERAPFTGFRLAWPR